MGRRRRRDTRERTVITHYRFEVSEVNGNTTARVRDGTLCSAEGETVIKCDGKG